MLLLGLLACDPSTPEAATPTEAPAVEAPVADLGAQVFATHCAACHGPEGRGDGPAAASLTPAPTDLTGPRPPERRGTPGGRRLVIEEGLPGTAMVGFKDSLTAEELDAVYGFVHQLRHGPGGR